MKNYFVYIITNSNNSVLYTGVTGNLSKRIWEHKEKVVPGFTQKYNLTKLVYYEVYNEALAAIAREKQIKTYGRQKKIDLILSKNPGF